MSITHSAPPVVIRASTGRDAWFAKSRCGANGTPSASKAATRSAQSNIAVSRMFSSFLVATPLPEAGFVNNPPRSADKTGVKFGLEGYPPTHHCLREWWWGDPGIGDLSLYNKDGLTLARIVLEDGGRNYLRSPVTRPRLSWTDLKEARHRAESVALSAIALDTADPKLAARIKKDNSTPHPMGPPLNREG